MYQVKKEASSMNAKEFIKALDHITEEKNISKDVVFEAMALALLCCR